MANNDNEVGSNSANGPILKTIDLTAIEQLDDKSSDKSTIIYTALGAGDLSRSQQQKQMEANTKTDLLVVTVNTLQSNHVANSSHLEKLSSLSEITLNVINAPSSTDEPLTDKVAEGKGAPLQENMRKRSSICTKQSVCKKIAKTPTNVSSKNVVSDEATEERPRRSRRSQKEIDCQDFININDPNLIFDQLSPNLNRTTILQKYKEKTIDLSRIKVKKEVSEALNIKLKSNFTLTSAKMSSLQNILVEHSKIFGKDFLEAVTNTCGAKLDANQLIEVMNVNDLITALRNKFKISELINMFEMADNPIAIKKVLKSVPDGKIINLLQSRIPSVPLFKDLMQNLPSFIPEDNGVPVETELVNDLTSGIINLLKSKKYLNNSEELFNYVLENGPDELSTLAKQNIKNVLLKKFSHQNLVDLLHEVIDLCVPSIKDEIIEIDD